MNNPSLHIKRVFREKVQKFLGCYFLYQDRDCLLKNNTSVMELIMTYGNNGKYTRIVYRMLICVVYSLIENYVCIDYLLCQSKTLSIISSNIIFKQTSFNISLGIGIP